MTRAKFFQLTWFQRVAGGILAVALLILALFFFFFFLVAASLLVLAGALRLAWAARQAKKRETADVLEGAYTVEEKERAQLSQEAGCRIQDSGFRNQDSETKE